jgi:hypothetical protein
MRILSLAGAVSAALLGAIVISGNAQVGSDLKSKPDSPLDWVTVVNNDYQMPGAPAGRTFNSYNQPSVNRHGLVVIRARSRGGPPLGPPTHGIYTRDMSDEASVITRILDKSTPVPDPNNLETTFVETPSFPRIDMDSDTIATRGNHQPVWSYVPGGETDETKAGTTGIYTNPFGGLITGASKLGAAPGYGFFEVPEFTVPFEVFPGAPSVTGGNTIVFKGNYTANGEGKTGVYFRRLEEGLHGGFSPAVLIANNSDTVIPGTKTIFGSTAPPSAAKGKVVFAGFDNEENPTKGGLYLAHLRYQSRLTTLVSIGEPVPGEPESSTFNAMGEGGAFDGRFVGFWGAWGETKTVRLYCQTEGNKDRIKFCNRKLVCEGTGELKEDINSICPNPNTPHPVYGDRCYQEKKVPVSQGFFVHDTKRGKTHIVAKTGDQFDEFLFWNYSGKTPCTGAGGHSEEGSEDDGEPARWRSSAFIAVAQQPGSLFNAAFKARKAEFENGLYVDPVDGIYLGKDSKRGTDIVTVLDTTMDGSKLDLEAPEGSTITELGIEREGLRGKWLAITASMGVEGGDEEDGMAGVYVTKLPAGNQKDDWDDDEDDD